MKKFLKIFFIIMVALVIVTFCLGTVNAVSTEMGKVSGGTTITADTGFLDIFRKVLGLLRLLTGLLSIIVIAYTGFELVTETPEGKKKVKEKMIPIVIGVLLVFMATTIATFIVGIFENNSTATSQGTTQGTTQRLSRQNGRW